MPVETQTPTSSQGAVSLADSYQHCAVVARTQAKNFYYSFLVLPPERRASLCAIYAFMRYSDDVSDGPGSGADSGAQMKEWRAALHRAFHGDYGTSRILPAFHDTAVRYGIPVGYFDELITGTEMDLTPRRYETFTE